MKYLSIMAGLAALALAPSVTAKSTVETWQPLSKTAMSITGPIRLSPSMLATAGKTFPLRVAADVQSYNSDLGVFPARILTVTRPMNPVLVNKNTLCSQPVRWIVVYRTGKDQLGMAVYQDGPQPRGVDSPGLCGTFNYVR